MLTFENNANGGHRKKRSVASNGGYFLCHGLSCLGVNLIFYSGGGSAYSPHDAWRLPIFSGRHLVDGMVPG